MISDRHAFTGEGRTHRSRCGAARTLSPCLGKGARSWLPTAAAILMVAFSSRAAELRFEMEPSTGALNILRAGERTLLFDTGLRIQTFPEGTIPQNRYNTHHFRRVTIRNLGRDRLVIGEAGGLLDYVTLVEQRRDTVTIRYRVTPHRDGRLALSLYSGISVPRPVPETLFFSDSGTVRFPAEPQKTASLSGNRYVGWRYADGTTVTVTPLDDSIGTMNLQDVRVQGGVHFIFNLFSRATGWRGREVAAVETIEFGLVIRVTGTEDAGRPAEQ